MEKKSSVLSKAIEWLGGIVFAAGIIFQYITAAHILVLCYLLTFRGLGLLIAFSCMFGRDREAEAAAINCTPSENPKIRWPDLLCPFLDTDVPEERGRALAELRAAGLTNWQIRFIRGIIGLGFVILIADEWLEFDFADVKSRWPITLLFDAIFTSVIYAFSATVGAALVVILLVETVAYLGILAFDKFVVKSRGA